MTISPNYRRRLVVMVKEPLPGRVKTRLGRDIGMIGAAWWFRQQMRRLLRNIQHPGWETILAVSPDNAGLKSRVWPENLPRIPQGNGDLGKRMAGVFNQLPAGPVVIIGADIPAISYHHILQAFGALGSHEAVFGPSEDGGYWAVGLQRNRPHPQRFLQGVRWSSKHALTDSVKTLPGYRVAYVDTLRDVDNVDDL